MLTLQAPKCRVIASTGAAPAIDTVENSGFKYLWATSAIRLIVGKDLSEYGENELETSQDCSTGTRANVAQVILLSSKGQGRDFILT